MQGSHWCRSALERYWIAPNQEHLNLGPTHRELIRQLLKTTNGQSGRTALQYWPANMRTLPFSHGVVVKAEQDDGAENSISSERNNSGLVLLISQPAHVRAKNRTWLLLQGDARYESIPLDWNRVKLAGMVVAHHGGKLNGVPSPAPSAIDPKDNLARNVICSVGGVNAQNCKPYGHPHADSLSAHKTAGWRVTTFTYDRVLHAECQKALGNYALSLDDAQPSCGCGCVCTSNLSLARILPT